MLFFVFALFRFSSFWPKKGVCERRGRKAEKALQIESENYASTHAHMSANIRVYWQQGSMDVRRETPVVKEAGPATNNLIIF